MTLRFSGIQGKSDPDKSLNNCSTYLFRTPQLFAHLPAFLRRQFQQQAHVPVFVYGGSNGSDAYALAIALAHQQQASPAPDVRFAITSLDIDPRHLKAPETIRLWEAEVDSLPSMASMAPSDMLTAFEKVPNTAAIIDNVLFEEDGYAQAQRQSSWLYKPTPWLANRVAFAEGDFLDFAQTPRQQPCVVFCRNFWYQLPEAQRETVAASLFNALKPKSLVVLGEFDIAPVCQNPAMTFTGNVDALLLKAGFKRVDDPVLGRYVFERATS